MSRLAYLAVFALLLAVNCQMSEEVICLAELTRHGARAPFQKGGPSADWMEGMEHSELTSLGHRQHYLLGKEMASRYPDIFYRKLKGDEYYVRSSQFQRTTTSAIAHLMGLWDHFEAKELEFENGNSRIQPPEVTYDSRSDTFKTPLPNGLVIAPVHTETTDEDDTLYFVSSKQCPKASEENINFKVQMGKDLASKQAQLDILKDVSKRLGVNYDSKSNKFELCSDLGDFVAMDNKHNPSPKVPPTDPAYKLLMRCYESAIVGKYAKQDVLKVVSAVLIEDILQKFNDKINSNHKFRYYLYTAHDTTLAPLLTMAGAMDPSCFVKDVLQNTYSDCKNYPDTASNIVFELVQVGEDYHYRMLSNFEPIDFCGLKNDKERYRCPASTFETKWRSMVNKDWQSYCSTPTRFWDYFKIQHSPWQTVGFYFIIIDSIALGLGIFFVYYFARKQRRLKSNLKVQGAIIDNEAFDS